MATSRKSVGSVAEDSQARASLWANVGSLENPSAGAALGRMREKHTQTRGRGCFAAA